ncbi:glycosyltransferase [Compostibacter hankyongensis]|uniref:Glycosyltransferase n=1 Tax=Compostibacter hankyongensis TaxID=1007089 RepID=A0ABP8FCX8_9BACT
MSFSFPQPKRILVAPLDWGLGHATRCIPIIRELTALGCEVLIGAEGKHAALLQQEFPRLSILPLPGYRITYADKGSGFGIKMLRQVPKLGKAIRRERRWLEEMVIEYKIDAVISDNRLGLFHKRIPCVIMTHQLLVKSPFHPSTDRWLQRINYFFINRFRECWVVDFEGPANLAGILSHPKHMPRHVRYLGALSRFESLPGIEKKYDLLVLISGPEPQRTHFEKSILRQLPQLPLKALVVSGQPGNTYDRMISATVRQVNHLDAGALAAAIDAAALVLTRSGYTTVMDLVRMRKKAVLVPTPGQTEQVYLGDYLMQKGYFYSVAQEGFALEQTLQACRNFRFQPLPEADMEQYKAVVTEFVKSL